jgi:anti-anti-sigma factor
MGVRLHRSAFAVRTVEARPAEFVVTVRFEGSEAVVGVRGEVDLFRAPDFGALLGAVIGQGHRAVVIDFAELTFIDASGLQVIAMSAHRLQRLGGKLAVRSPSAMFRRMVEVTRLSGLVQLAEVTVADHLGMEESVTLAAPRRFAHPASGPHHLRAISAVPADHDVVDAALRLVVALARATVGGADGVSVSLRRHGRLATVAASDQTISEMDANQYATGEGPCVDASLEGRWFHAEALDRETRWPAFTPRARALGINAILSSPLLSDAQPVGALNIYSRTSAAFTPKDQELAATFAAEASSVLTRAGADITDEGLAERLADALRARQIIATSLGVIMEREHIDEDRAYTLLRQFSQTSNQPLRDRATAVVASAKVISTASEIRPEDGTRD